MSTTTPLQEHAPKNVLNTSSSRLMAGSELLMATAAAAASESSTTTSTYSSSSSSSLSTSSTSTSSSTVPPSSDEDHDVQDENIKKIDDNEVTVEKKAATTKKKTTAAGTASRRHHRPLLEIDMYLVPNVHSCDKKHDPLDPTHHKYHSGDTTYRQDGFTIGTNYMRFEGKTITRGQLLPSSLTVEGMIGRGAFSKVHKAIWKTTKKKPSSRKDGLDVTYDNDVKEDDDDDTTHENTIVAVKQCSVLDISEQRQDMLLKELRTLCQLQSETLVGFYGAFLQNDSVVMVMEYMDGGSLEQVLKRKRKKRKQHSSDNSCSYWTFPQPVLLSVAFQVLMGLKFLHSHRVLHRDIKPGNILFNMSDGAVKLCDFGIASLGDQSLQKTVVGTSRYMSPERLRARPYGKSSDVWSFGLVILECITGKIPWEDCESIISLVITVEETKTEDMIPLDVSKELSDILSNSLQKEPEKRIPAGVMLMSPWFVEKSDGIAITLPEARRSLLAGWDGL
jgi:predicted Ser/Thr protein kinase